MRCDKCHRVMKGTTAYDGACDCGGLIEATPEETAIAVAFFKKNYPEDYEYYRTNFGQESIHQRERVISH